ncbi:MAG TPA: CAP domain-containing protein [Actinomycetota bacterium]|nr:CAP domain-containing protein [Actinomycetota bacterium]
MPLARALRLGRPLTLATIASVLVGLIPFGSAHAAPAADGGVDGPAATQLGSRYSFNGTEKCLMRRINQVRRQSGRRALSWDKQIGYVARRHTNAMASQRNVYHDGSLGQKVTRWRRLAQNTGKGQGCRGIFRAFMNSSAHRANIFGRWRHVGVGVSWAAGCIWVQQVFEARRDPGNIYSYP